MKEEQIHYHKLTNGDMGRFYFYSLCRKKLTLPIYYPNSTSVPEYVTCEKCLKMLKQKHLI